MKISSLFVSNEQRLQICFGGTSSSDGNYSTRTSPQEVEIIIGAGAMYSEQSLLEYAVPWVLT